MLHKPPHNGVIRWDTFPKSSFKCMLMDTEEIFDCLYGPFGPSITGGLTHSGVLGYHSTMPTRFAYSLLHDC